MGNDAGGADIEIVETHQAAGLGVIVPNSVRINGNEVLIPSGSKIIISEISDDDVVTATITMFVRSLSLRSEAKGDAA